MSAAVAEGILKLSKGVYVDRAQDTEVPISTAMQDGLIAVGHSRSLERRKQELSYGVITVRSHCEHKPFQVLAVFDVQRGIKCDPQEAVQKGICLVIIFWKFLILSQELFILGLA